MDPSTATVEKTSLLFTAFEVSMKAGSQTIEPCQQSLGIQKSKDLFTEMKMVFSAPILSYFSFFGNVVRFCGSALPNNLVDKDGKKIWASLTEEWKPHKGRFPPWPRCQDVSFDIPPVPETLTCSFPSQSPFNALLEGLVLNTRSGIKMDKNR